jgi:hypothetical protein
MTNQNTCTAPLGYIANIIIQGFEREGHHSVYISEKRDKLAELDKFRSLLFLHSCGEGIQLHVANTIGVTLEELQTAIRVLGNC